MGGGTTKFSLIEDGVVSQTAAISIGARLIAFDENDVITRIEDAGRTMMKELGYRVELGQKITEEMKEDFGAYMQTSTRPPVKAAKDSPTPPFWINVTSLGFTPPDSNIDSAEK